MLHSGTKIISETTKKGKVQPGLTHLEGLILKTTGQTPEGLMGVLKSTTKGASKVKDSVQKYEGKKVATQPVSYGQVPYAGPKY
jgi:hypothetical protein